MTSRTTAADRYRRILAMVPWIAQRSAPTLEEVAEHFNISVKQLMADLDVVLLVGIPPYLPGDFIDVSYESGHVDLRLNDLFTRPLQLTASEALSVLTSSAALRTFEADDNGPLARALAKLQVALGVPDQSIDISLGHADPAVLQAIKTAVAQRLAVQIDYYSGNTDTATDRTIEPTRLYATGASWYVAGWCRKAEAHRVFRADRIRSAALSSESFDAPDEVPAPVNFAPHDDMARIGFDLDDGVRVPWSVAQPELTERLADGRRRVIYAIGGDMVLARIVLEIGDSGTVVDPAELSDRYRTVLGPDDVAGARAAAAERILARYRSTT